MSDKNHGAYQQAGSGVLSVQKWKVGSSGKVAGRFALKGQQLELTWGSGTAVFKLSPSLDAKALATFNTGDLVLVATEEGIAHSIQLLAPIQDSSPSRRASTVRDASHSQISKKRFEEFKRWTFFLRNVRDFFLANEFIETPTPTLVPSPGTEAFLDPFMTKWKFGSEEKLWYLPTSPEFHLKKILAGGFDQIFEIKSCFRNGELGDHHLPEFTMLEWYRAFNNLNSLIEDCEALFRHLANAFEVEIPALERLTVAGAWKRHLGFELTPTTTAAQLTALCEKLQISVRADDDFDDLYFRLFIEHIEPKLGIDGPVLLSHYPPSQSALARLNADGWAERFELYWRGLELANAFDELNDPAENRARFNRDNKKKLEVGREPVPIDEELMVTFDNGFPPTAGIALGLERLYMALFDIKDISELKLFRY